MLIYNGSLLTTYRYFFLKYQPQERMHTMRKKVVVALTLIMSSMALLTGCTEAARVSQNLSEEADNFNICRQIVVVNNDTGDVLYEFEGFFRNWRREVL